MSFKSVGLATWQTYFDIAVASGMKRIWAFSEFDHLFHIKVLLFGQQKVIWKWKKKVFSCKAGFLLCCGCCSMILLSLCVAPDPWSNETSTSDQRNKSLTELVLWMNMLQCVESGFCHSEGELMLLNVSWVKHIFIPAVAKLVFGEKPMSKVVIAKSSTQCFFIQACPGLFNLRFCPRSRIPLEHKNEPLIKQSRSATVRVGAFVEVRYCFANVRLNATSISICVLGL